MKPYAVQLWSQPPSAPLDLADDHCLLFAYGQLQPHLRAPQTLMRAWPDQVRGLLYDLGPYPAAVRVAAADRCFHGYVLEITLAELTDRLDPYEEVDNGVYRRIRIVTEAGFAAWLYEYTRPLPKNAVGPIDRWPQSPKTRCST